MSPAPCAVCGEQRLRPESLAVKIAGLSIADFTALALAEARAAVDKIRGKLTLRQRKIAGRPLTEIAERIDFLLAVGLGYLTLDTFRGNAFGRRSAAHSPGDANRLAAARRAVRARRTFDRPCTRATMAACSARSKRCATWATRCSSSSTTKRRFAAPITWWTWGPARERPGGYLVATGAPEEIAANPASLTGQYLSGQMKIAVPRSAASPNGKAIHDSWRARQQSEEYRRGDSARAADGRHRRFRLGEIDAGERHSLSRARGKTLPLDGAAGRAPRDPRHRAHRQGRRRSIRRRSGGRRVRIPRRTRASSRRSASFSPCCRNRANAATSRGASAST